jgi:hypothetical protein
MAGSALKRPSVEPVFLDQEQAIDYATGRACFRSGEIRILDSSGAVERIIPFTETDRNCDAVIAFTLKSWQRDRNV